MEIIFGGGEENNKKADTRLENLQSVNYLPFGYCFYSGDPNGMERKMIQSALHWDIYEDYCVWCGQYVRENEFAFRFITIHTCSFRETPHYINRVIHERCRGEVLVVKEKCGIEYAMLQKISKDMHLPVYERLQSWIPIET